MRKIPLKASVLCRNYDLCGEVGAVTRRKGPSGPFCGQCEKYHPKSKSRVAQIGQRRVDNREAVPVVVGDGDVVAAQQLAAVRQHIAGQVVVVFGAGQNVDGRQCRGITDGCR